MVYALVALQLIASAVARHVGCHSICGRVHFRLASKPILVRVLEILRARRDGDRSALVFRATVPRTNHSQQRLVAVALEDAAGNIR